MNEEKINVELALVDAARAMQGNIHRLIDADLLLERLNKAKEVASILTVKMDANSTPIKLVLDFSLVCLTVSILHL